MAAPPRSQTEESRPRIVCSKIPIWPRCPWTETSHPNRCCMGQASKRSNLPRILTIALGTWRSLHLWSRMQELTSESSNSRSGASQPMTRATKSWRKCIWRLRRRRSQILGGMANTMRSWVISTATSKTISYKWNRGWATSSSPAPLGKSRFYSEVLVMLAPSCWVISEAVITARNIRVIPRWIRMLKITRSWKKTRVWLCLNSLCRTRRAKRTESWSPTRPSRSFTCLSRLRDSSSTKICRRFNRAHSRLPLRTPIETWPSKIWEIKSPAGIPQWASSTAKRATSVVSRSSQRSWRSTFRTFQFLARSNTLPKTTIAKASEPSKKVEIIRRPKFWTLSVSPCPIAWPPIRARLSPLNWLLLPAKCWANSSWHHPTSRFKRPYFSKSRSHLKIIRRNRCMSQWWTPPQWTSKISTKARNPRSRSETICRLLIPRLL